MTTAAAPHPWKFVRLGGLDQVVIDRASDLAHLHELDPKLWVALACPVKGLELDDETLGLIDTDGDGRIRVPEILAAIKWAQLHLKDVGDLLSGRDYLPLAAINDSTPDGRGTLASARAILSGLGQSDADRVTLAQADDTVKLFAATTLNGDGIITVETASEEAVKRVIGEIISCVGSVTDRSGKPGIDQTRAETFYAACAACIDWLAKGNTPEVLTLGDATAAAAAAVDSVRAKIDDYFARTQLAAFDERSIAALNRAETEYLALAAQDLKITAEEVAHLPLAHIAAGRSLPLSTGINPAWVAKISVFRRDAIGPMFGAELTELTAAEWAQIKAKVAPYLAWLGTKAGDVVEKLGPDRIEEILVSDTRKHVNDLIAQDKALEPEFNAVHGVERLCRYTRDFPALLRNFVNFFDFYSPDRAATFQAGTLFLDSRSTDLCVQVAGPSPLAAMSKAYIAYCDCSRLGKTMKIAACFTQGDSDYLFVGRNGVFYDRQGRDWDAKITAVVDNPISVRQAFFLPYKKFVRMIEEQAAKRAAAAEAKSDAKLAAAATSTADAATKGPAKPTEPKKVDVGAVAAIGVAVTGAVSALTLILGYVFGLAAWQYPLVLIGLIAVISGPSMLIAWLKLRQRTVGPILEGNGWAINGRVKISVPFGTRLTARAKIPAGSSRSMQDPYEDKETSRRARLIALLTVVLAVVAIRVHAVQFNEGYYFWQSKPTAVVILEASGAPVEVSPSAANVPAPTP